MRAARRTTGDDQASRPDPQGGWRLFLRAGEAFDDAIPFRSILADVAGALGQDPRTDLALPDHEDAEDFIEGTLRFGANSLRIYYEHALGYLTLTSASESLLRDVAGRIGPIIVVD